MLKELNTDLASKVFLVGFELSAADVALAVAMKDDLVNFCRIRRRIFRSRKKIMREYSNSFRNFEHRLEVSFSSVIFKAKRAKGKKTNLYSDFSNVCRWYFDFYVEM